MSYQLYRNTTLGNSLQESLDELIQSQQISPQLALQVLLQFDKAINSALATKVKNRINFKGRLNVYRFCDNVWTFVLNNVTFREVGDSIKVDKVKIVACDGKESKGGTDEWHGAFYHHCIFWGHIFIFIVKALYISFAKLLYFCFWVWFVGVILFIVSSIKVNYEVWVTILKVYSVSVFIVTSKVALSNFPLPVTLQLCNFCCCVISQSLPPVKKTVDFIRKSFKSCLCIFLPFNKIFIFSKIYVELWHKYAQKQFLVWMIIWITKY